MGRARHQSEELALVGGTVYSRTDVDHPPARTAVPQVHQGHAEGRPRMDAAVAILTVRQPASQALPLHVARAQQRSHLFLRRDRPLQLDIGGPQDTAHRRAGK